MKTAEFGMLSETNLQFLWDDRSRHGVDLVASLKKLGSPYVDELDDIKRRRKRRRKARDSCREAERLGRPSDEKLKKLRRRTRQLAKATHRYLSVVQSEMTASSFRLTVVKGPAPRGAEKQTYRLRSGSPDATYFAARALQADLNDAFAIKFQGRSDLIKTFVSVLKGTWTKTVVRADIEAFYESVSHVELLAAVDANRALSALSKAWIRQILYGYANLSFPVTKVGLPRGVGPSASLAEMFLGEFDREFRNRPECVFYARYVDDIVMVMAPVDDREVPPSGYLAAMDATLIQRGLTLSVDPAKRSESHLRKGSASNRVSVTLLGYQIDHSVASGAVELEMAQRRKDRLLLRLNRVFDVYERSTSRSGRSARLLERRVRLLTGNTRLINSKRDAFTGIHFSNSQLSKGGALRHLDGILTKRIADLIALGVPPGITTRLSKASFVGGFDETRFVTFSSAEWREIASVWNDLA